MRNEEFVLYDRPVQNVHHSLLCQDMMAFDVRLEFSDGVGVGHCGLRTRAQSNGVDGDPPGCVHDRAPLILLSLTPERMTETDESKDIALHEVPICAEIEITEVSLS